MVYVGFKLLITPRFFFIFLLYRDGSLPGQIFHKDFIQSIFIGFEQLP